MNTQRNDMQSQLRRHVLSVGVAAALLVVGLGGWAATTEFAGAVIAAGQLVVDSTSRRCSTRPVASLAC
jgi:HlyD family secretion protein